MLLWGIPRTAAAPAARAGWPACVPQSSAHSRLKLLLPSSELLHPTSDEPISQSMSASNEATFCKGACVPLLLCAHVAHVPLQCRSAMPLPAPASTAIHYVPRCCSAGNACQRITMGVDVRLGWRAVAAPWGMHAAPLRCQHGMHAVGCPTGYPVLAALMSVADLPT